MSLQLDDRLRGTGTRFRLFAQSRRLAGFEEPELVWISSPPSRIRSGPADDRFRTILPLDKAPYADDEEPPYRGAVLPPVAPGPDGHFDHIAPDHPDFLSAHMFGVARRVFDIWEDYLGGPIPWAFDAPLELISWVDWNNAQAGYGFIETGYDINFRGELEPFCLNFDVLAHEMGHLLLYCIVDEPPPERLSAQYRGFHEAMADMVALISSLHFERMLDRVLESCNGNLYHANELHRLAEISQYEQVRIAANALRMSQIHDPTVAAADMSQAAIHELGEPLLGACFDILVEIYHWYLVRYRVLPERTRKALLTLTPDELHANEYARDLERAYATSPAGFRQALIDARDYVGICLASIWRGLHSNDLSFSDVRNAWLAVDRERFGARHQDEIRENFDWREIYEHSVGVRRKQRFHRMSGSIGGARPGTERPRRLASEIARELRSRKRGRQ